MEKLLCASTLLVAAATRRRMDESDDSAAAARCPALHNDVHVSPAVQEQLHGLRVTLTPVVARCWHQRYTVEAIAPGLAAYQRDAIEAYATTRLS
jgi:hypothetical protein